EPGVMHKSGKGGGEYVGQKTTTSTTTLSDFDQYGRPHSTYTSYRSSDGSWGWSRITNMVYNNLGLVVSQHEDYYSYTANVAKNTDQTVRGSKDVTFAYDALNQLISTRDSNVHETSSTEQRGCTKFMNSWIGKVIKLVIDIVLTMTGVGILVVFAINFLWTYIATGSLKMALIAGVMSAATAGVGASGLDTWVKVILNATIAVCGTYLATGSWKAALGAGLGAAVGTALSSSIGGTTGAIVGGVVGGAVAFGVTYALTGSTRMAIIAALNAAIVVIADLFRETGKDSGGLFKTDVGKQVGGIGTFFKELFKSTSGAQFQTFMKEFIRGVISITVEQLLPQDLKFMATALGALVSAAVGKMLVSMGGDAAKIGLGLMGGKEISWGGIIKDMAKQTSVAVVGWAAGKWLGAGKKEGDNSFLVPIITSLASAVLSGEKLTFKYLAHMLAGGLVKAMAEYNIVQMQNLFPEIALNSSINSMFGDWMRAPANVISSGLEKGAILKGDTVIVLRPESEVTLPGGETLVFSEEGEYELPLDSEGRLDAESQGRSSDGRTIAAVVRKGDKEVLVFSSEFERGVEEGSLEVTEEAQEAPMSSVGQAAGQSVETAEESAGEKKAAPAAGSATEGEGGTRKWTVQGTLSGGQEFRMEFFTTNQKIVQQQFFVATTDFSSVEAVFIYNQQSQKFEAYHENQKFNVYFNNQKLEVQVGRGDDGKLHLYLTVSRDEMAIQLKETFGQDFDTKQFFAAIDELLAPGALDKGIMLQVDFNANGEMELSFTAKFSDLSKTAQAVLKAFNAVNAEGNPLSLDDKVKIVYRDGKAYMDFNFKSSAADIKAALSQLVDQGVYTKEEAAKVQEHLDTYLQQDSKALLDGHAQLTVKGEGIIELKVNASNLTALSKEAQTWLREAGTNEAKLVFTMARDKAGKLTVQSHMEFKVASENKATFFKFLASQDNAAVNKVADLFGKTFGVSNLLEDAQNILSGVDLEIEADLQAMAGKDGTKKDDPLKIKAELLLNVLLQRIQAGVPINVNDALFKTMVDAKLGDAKIKLVFSAAADQPILEDAKFSSSALPMLIAKCPPNSELHQTLAGMRKFSQGKTQTIEMHRGTDGKQRFFVSLDVSELPAGVSVDSKGPMPTHGPVRLMWTAGAQRPVLAAGGQVALHKEVVMKDFRLFEGMAGAPLQEIKVKVTEIVLGRDRLGRDVIQFILAEPFAEGLPREDQTVSGQGNLAVNGFKGETKAKILGVTTIIATRDGKESWGAGYRLRLSGDMELSRETEGYKYRVLQGAVVELMGGNIGVVDGNVRYEATRATEIRMANGSTLMLKKAGDFVEMGAHGITDCTAGTVIRAADGKSQQILLGREGDSSAMRVRYESIGNQTAEITLGDGSTLVLRAGEYVVMGAKGIEDFKAGVEIVSADKKYKQVLMERVGAAIRTRFEALTAGAVISLSGGTYLILKGVGDSVVIGEKGFESWKGTVLVARGGVCSQIMMDHPALGKVTLLLSETSTSQVLGGKFNVLMVVAGDGRQLQLEKAVEVDLTLSGLGEGKVGVYRDAKGNALFLEDTKVEQALKGRGNVKGVQVPTAKEGESQQLMFERTQSNAELNNLDVSILVATSRRVDASGNAIGNTLFLETTTMAQALQGKGNVKGVQTPTAQKGEFRQVFFGTTQFNANLESLDTSAAAVSYRRVDAEGHALGNTVFLEKTTIAQALNGRGTAIGVQGPDGRRVMFVRAQKEADLDALKYTAAAASYQRFNENGEAVGPVIFLTKTSVAQALKGIGSAMGVQSGQRQVMFAVTQWGVNLDAVNLRAAAASYQRVDGRGRPVGAAVFLTDTTAREALKGSGTAIGVQNRDGQRVMFAKSQKTANLDNLDYDAGAASYQKFDGAGKPEGNAVFLQGTNIRDALRGRGTAVGMETPDGRRVMFSAPQATENLNALNLQASAATYQLFKDQKPAGVLVLLTNTSIEQALSGRGT
ncbi:MAG TPA: hypothetical protein P5079_08865, partial [Elusimicrobiota bacterium]|nr:hypothetical protein [Elusimicrobiota bacterium]